MKDTDAHRHSILALLVLCIALLIPSVAKTTLRVSHCTTGDGSSVYTDGSCRAIGARAQPIPARLLGNLVREAARNGDAPTSLATAVHRPRTSGRTTLHRPTVDECPRTPAQLAAKVRGALGGGDVNALAALYDWDGMTDRQAKVVLRRLESMSDRPLIDGQFFNASDFHASAGFVQLVHGASAAPSVTELEVTRQAGCLLLRF